VFGQIEGEIMPIDNNVKEKLILRPTQASFANQAEPVLQRYGNLELRHSDSVDLTRAAPMPAVDPAQLSLTETLAWKAFQLRGSDLHKAAKLARPRDKQRWDMRGCIVPPPGPTAAPGLAAPAPAPATMPTSGFLEGSVAVATIMVSGPTDDLRFTEAEQTKVVAEVQSGLSWLASQALSSKMTFVHDIRLAQINVAADPAAADLEAHWRDPAMASLGYSASWQGVTDYVRALRDQMQTQWAYAAFFVKYPLGWFAYASIGGPRLVMQYANDGWGPDNIDRVFVHETGHVFGLPDEYASSGCNCGGEWGRFLEPNRNCENCAGASGVSCIMRANDYNTCQSSRAQYGWSGWAAPIVAAHSHAALDVSGASTDPGAQVIQWPWHGAANQRFLADPLDDGTFRLVAEHSGLVLDVAGASTAAGALVVQSTWNSNANQRFRLERQTDGTYRIVAKHSGLALDVEGASVGNGARLIQWPWHGGNNQRFRLLTRGVSIKSVHSDLALDVSGFSYDPGAVLIQWPLHGGANQRFRPDVLEDGSWRILVEHSGMVLDVAGASTAQGARIIQWPWHGGNNQRFRLDSLGNGTFRIVALHSDLVLDINGASTGNGAELIQWRWHGGNNQRFALE
jgi:hypothetical protein